MSLVKKLFFELFEDSGRFPGNHPTPADLPHIQPADNEFASAVEAALRSEGYCDPGGSSGRLLVDFPEKAAADQ